MGMKTVIRQLFFITLFVPLSCYCFVLFTLIHLVHLFHLITGKQKNKPNGYLQKEPECLNDSQFGEHGYLELKKRDLTIHYVANGDRSKPLMLFLHGFPQFWYTWKKQLVEFGTDYYAVAIDLPGYGYSSIPKEKSRYDSAEISLDIREFILELGYESCILVGHDWGAVIAFHTAIEHPEVVDKLINMNVPHKKAFDDSKSFTQLLRSSYIFFFQIPYLPEFYLSANDYLILKRIYTNGTNPNYYTDEEIDSYKYIFNKSRFTGGLNYYRNLIKFTREGSGKVKMPSVLIWGTEDRALGVELAAATEKYLENGRVIYVDGVSHFVHTDAPDVVHKHMREFLNGQ